MIASRTRDGRRVVEQTTIAVSSRMMALLMVIGLSAGPALAGPPAAPPRHSSITDRSVDWPTWGQWRRVLLMQDYNTRVVVLGTALLGFSAGTIGSFTLLRKRALMGDALSHATLPGIALAFVLVTLAGGEGKSLPVLLTGAAISGVIGVGAILLIRNLTRLKEDAALGIVLSVFFGAGIAILGVVQQMQSGHAAGLEAFIYGKTASMIASDAWRIGAAGLAAVVICAALFKEFKLLCFDEAFAASRGYPVVLLDVVLMALVVTVTIIGLQAVGLILMIALLVVPAAAARFWTEQMVPMTAVAALIGATGAMVGATMSAIFPRLPSGAMIVVVAAFFFLVSMIFGPARGVLIRAIRRRQLNRKVGRQHLLRAVYERLESDGIAPQPDSQGTVRPVAFQDLLAMRSWSPQRLSRQIRRACREGLVEPLEHGSVRLTPHGAREAARVVREHRLWELYLITHADIAPSQVDRDADAIEHVLDAGMIAELESLLHVEPSPRAVADSPHPLARAEGEPERGG